MKPFEDIRLEWAGTAYTIPADKVMGAISRIEDQVTLAALYDMASRNDVKLTRIAAAYGAVLRYAGASVSDGDVYAGMFGQQGGERAVTAAVSALLGMMIPPNAVPPSEAASPGKSMPAARASSKQPSRRRSASGA